MGHPQTYSPYRRTYWRKLRKIKRHSKTNIFHSILDFRGYQGWSFYKWPNRIFYSGYDFERKSYYA